MTVTSYLALTGSPRVSNFFFAWGIYLLTKVHEEVMGNGTVSIILLSREEKIRIKLQRSHLHYSSEITVKCY